MTELASYASDPAASPGRMVSEPPSVWRNEFQRDRDRIIHATSFRRLKGKTQVFLAGEGDHYRTRLTHTLEVAQIARSLARVLGFNEDLTEALALAHDLGHPPFGHAGERALDRVMSLYGGFDHNIQSLRVVTRLERRYPKFDGLNLTWEMLEGLTKHNGPAIAKASDRAALRPTILTIDAWHDLELARFAAGEAQCAALADDIAYNAHDIDDGLRSGLLTLDRLARVPALARLIESTRADYPDIAEDRVRPEIVRRLIGWFVEDAVSETSARLARSGASSAEDVRGAGQQTVAFSEPVAADEAAIKQFLHAELYRNPSVTRVMGEAETIVTELFNRYWSMPTALPPAWRGDMADGDEDRRARQIADFLAGMTDGFALGEYRRLFDRMPEFG